MTSGSHCSKCKTATYHASILSWPLWESFKTLELIQPMHNAEDLQLSKFVDNIEEDCSGNHNQLDDFFERTEDMDFIQHSLFPNEILWDPSSCA